MNRRISGHLQLLMVSFLHACIVLFLFLGCSSTGPSPLDEPERLKKAGIMNKPTTKNNRSSSDRSTSSPNKERGENTVKRWGMNQNSRNEGQPQKQHPPVKKEQSPDKTSRETSSDSSSTSDQTYKFNELNSLPDLLQQLESELQKMPGRRKALILRTTIYHLLNKQKEAATTLENLKEEDDDLSELLEALTYYNIGANKRALKKLEAIRSRWQKSTPVRIEKAIFVDSVTGFEKYNRVSRRIFAPGEFLKLYVRVSNFGTEKKGNRHKVSFRVKFDIIKSTWDPVTSKNTEKTVDLPASVRKANNTLTRTYDFRIERKHLAIGIPLPENIQQGKNYLIKLEVEDKIWNTSNVVKLPFQIQ